MLKIVKKWSLIVLMILMLVETSLFFSWENIFGCFVMLYGWGSLCYFIFRQSVIERHPVIFIVSLGLGIFYYYFPLVGTLLAFRPLTYQFRIPYDVFVHQFIYVSAYLMAFLLYTKSNFKPRNLRKLLVRCKVFHTPTDLQLWMMGVLGVFVFLYLKVSFGVIGQDGASISSLVRFIMPIKNFIYAPILLLFKDLYTWKAVKVKSNTIVYIYLVGIVIMSLLGNGRQYMISSIILLLLLFVFDAVVKRKSLQKALPLKRVLLVMGLVLIIAGPGLRMIAAMGSVRDLRHDVSAQELFVATIKAYSSSELDEKMKVGEAMLTGQFDWSEDYTGNDLFDRLCNLRIADMTLYFAEEADMENQRAFQIFLEQLIAQVPTPILNKLGFSFNKYSLESTYTVSSIARVEVTGYGSGGKSVAAHTGAGIWLFGVWYPLFFIIIYFLLFFLFDSLVIRVNNRYRYSVLFLINIYFFFSFLNFKNGIISDILFMFRPYIQMCFMYIIIFYCTRSISQIINKA